MYKVGPKGVCVSNCKEMQLLRIMRFGLVFKLLEWVFRQETQVFFSSLVGRVNTYWTGLSVKYNEVIMYDTSLCLLSVASIPFLS